MKFGVCCSPDRSGEMAELGFDFVEWSVAGNLATSGESEIQHLRDVAQKLPVTPEVWNILLPGDLKIVGPDIDPDQLSSYLQRVLPLVRELGGELIVFGSGRARTIPEGFERMQAEEQFRTATVEIADAAQSNGLLITLEPLRAAESNLVNMVNEGLALVQQLQHPALHLLVDMYHMLENGEDFGDIQGAGASLRHAHVASADKRLVPLNESDVSDLRGFLGELKSAGYNQRVSFETRTESLDEFKRGVEIMRDVWAAA